MGRIIAENKNTGKLYPVDSKAIYRVIYEVVDVLPTENIKTSVIYCVPVIGKKNEYDMFLYINSDWVSIGSGSIDLSDYYTKEEIAELLSDKMDLAPLNPTAEQIAAMPSGQVYGDTANHKGVIKGGQSFYDTVYIEKNYRRAFKSSDFENDAYYPPYNIPSDILARFSVGDSYAVTAASNGRAFTLVRVERGVSIVGTNYIWQPQYFWLRQIYGSGDVPNQEPLAYRQMPDGSYYYATQFYFEGDMLYYKKPSSTTIDELYICVGVSYTKTSSPVSIIANYTWQELPVPKNYYTKTEIDTKIGDIGTALDTLNNNLAEV